MNYTRHFARLTLKALFSSGYFYITVAAMTFLFFLIVPKLAPLLNDKVLAELLAGQLVYILLSTGILLVFMCAQPVFVSEKQQGALIPLLYSPASAGELLLGKCLGVMAAALFGSAVSLLVPLGGYPVMLKAFLSLNVAAALVIVFGIIFSYAAIAGMLLLCSRSIKVLYPVMFFLNYVPMQLQKYVKDYLLANGLGSANWLHLAPLVFLLAAAALLYRFYFSKQRITASV